MSGRFHDDMTLRTARNLLRTLVDEGHTCPCCTQMAKVYKRKLNSAMARTLITMLRHGAAREFVHGPSLPGDTHELSQLAWWELVEEERARRQDGGRAGWWRLTAHGVAFIRGEVKVAKYARIYDSRRIGLAGENVDIRACLGSRFDYRELMEGL